MSHLATSEYILWFLYLQNVSYRQKKQPFAIWDQSSFSVAFYIRSGSTLMKVCIYDGNYLFVVDPWSATKYTVTLCQAVTQLGIWEGTESVHVCRCYTVPLDMFLFYLLLKTKDEAPTSVLKDYSWNSKWAFFRILDKKKTFITWATSLS
jgi:hypothetical protein